MSAFSLFRQLPLIFAMLTLMGALVHAHAEEKQSMTGKLYEYIEPTDPFRAFINSASADPKLKSIGWNKSPKVEGNEMADALYEFSDVAAAMANLEALKRKAGFTGGRVFAGFIYDENGGFQLLCGISKTQKGDWEDTRDGTADIGSEFGSSFYNFKLASRADRVRAIARCLSQLKGMPALKPKTSPGITGLYIDEASYTLAEEWFRARGMTSGSRAQYRSALDCIAAEIGRKLPEGTGDTVVMKTSLSRITHRTESSEVVGFRHMDTDVEFVSNIVLAGVAVMSRNTARHFARDGLAEDLGGIWPTRAGLASDAFEQLIKPAAASVPLCELQAGLITASMLQPLQNKHCQ